MLSARMERSEGDFNAFGEGFNRFPKIIPQDCVAYTIYVIDAKLSDFQVQEQLRQVQKAGIKLTNELLKDFIWQRERIHFDLAREKGKLPRFAHLVRLVLNSPTLGRRCLRGRTTFGDSIEDEWLIVYILRELSKAFAQIWVTIVDSDGQFLLIEAANALPNWLNPEIADYRVWINSGKLFIIPIKRPENGTAQKESRPGVLTLDDALAFLQENQAGLLHLPAVELEAFYRLQKYPKQISDSLHHARIFIPRKLAFILHHDPSYISAAVEAFYLRDPIAMRPLQTCDPKGLNFAPTDCVNVSIKFTKIGYAQLTSQSFEPPPVWKDFQATNSDPELQELINMGMKVACGFEMLISDSQSQDKKVVREIKLLLEDLETGEDHLPSDAEISKWQMNVDDESWLDIDFHAFEKELAGEADVDKKDDKGGFGDRDTQEQLRKIVTRFQSFLNDDAAGIEGAEYMDDMDNDDDETSTSSEDTEANDEKEINFNEDHFTQMMREMLGMASTSANAGDNKHIVNVSSAGSGGISCVRTEGDDEEEVFQNMHEMEKELREAGALEVGSKQPFETSGLQQDDVKEESDAQAPEEPDIDDEDVEIDFNLAKNLLESFKAQGGMAGPTGNLMGLMGLQLPRDEDRGGSKATALKRPSGG